jgi:hypothetical protein
MSLNKDYYIEVLLFWNSNFFGCYKTRYVAKWDVHLFATTRYDNADVIVRKYIYIDTTPESLWPHDFGCNNRSSSRCLLVTIADSNPANVIFGKQTTDTQREFFFKNSKLLGLGRQIGLKFYEAFGVFLAKLLALFCHCESLVHGKM